MRPAAWTTLEDLHTVLDTLVAESCFDIRKSMWGGSESQEDLRISPSCDMKEGPVLFKRRHYSRIKGGILFISCYMCI